MNLSPPGKSSHGRLLALLVAAAVLAPDAKAAVLYKDVTTTDLNTVANWSTASNAATPDPASIGTADELYFNSMFAPTAGSPSTTYTGSLSAGLTVGSVRFDNGVNNANLVIDGNFTLTLNGAGDLTYTTAGIVLNSGTGGSLTFNCNLALGAAQTWVNSRTLTVAGNVNLGAFLLTSYTAGSGITTIDGIVSGSMAAGSNAIFLNGTSTGTLRLTNASNSFTGNIEFGGSSSNVLEFTSAGALGATTAGQIRFRNTGGAGSILRYTGTTAQTVQKAFQCDTNVGIRLESNSSGGSVDFSGSWSASSSARPVFLGGTGTGDNKVSGAIVGSNLTKNGAGKWILSNAANSYAGVTNINGGTLAVAKLANGGSSSSIGTSSNAAASVVFNGGWLSYVGSGDSTDRGFTVTGTGLALSSDGTGALTWTSATATAFTTANTAYTFRLGGANTGANVFGTVIANNGTGAISLTKQDAGAWAVTGNNSYTGTTTLSAGTLRAGHNSAFGTSTLALNGGTLSSDGASARSLANAVTLGGDIALGDATNSGSLTLGGTVGLGAATRTLTVNSAVTLSGVVSNGGLVKAGSGTLTLSGDNSYTSGTTINAGTLALGASNRLADAGAVTLGGGTLDIASYSDTVAAVSISSGSVLGTTGTLTTSGISASVASGTATIDALTAGTGSLSKSGAGTLSLLKAASHSGGTGVSGGVLSLGASNLLADAGAVTVSGGTLAIGANSDTIGSLSVSTGSVTGTGTLTTGSSVAVSNTAGTVTISAVLAGSAGLTKSGGGELVLSGANTYSGTTAVNAGTLSVSGSIGAVTVANAAKLRGTGTVGALTLANGSLVDAGISGLGSLAIGNIAVDPAAQSTFSVLNVGNYAATPAFSAGTLTFGSGGGILFNVSGFAAIGSYGLLSYSGTINQADFSLNYTGLSSRSSGRLDFGTAGVINYLVSGNQPKWRGTSSDWSAADAWVLTPSGGNTTFQSADAVIFDDSASSGSVAITADVDPVTLTFNGNTLSYSLVSSGGVVASAASLSKTGNALLTIGGANTYTGGSTLSAGRTRVAHNSALGTGTITLGAAALSSDGATARTLANNVVVSGNATLGDATDNGALTLSGTVDLGGVGRSLTIASATTLGGIVSNGALTKLGNATLTLSGANTYAGGTTVSAGTLVLGASNVLADAGALSLASGTTLDATGRTETLGALAVDGATVTGGTLTASSVSATAGTIASVLAGAGGLTKSGNGTLVLSSANTYTGGTTVSAGTLQLGHATDTLANTGAVIVNGGTLDLGSNSDSVGALTFTSGAITGTGTLTTGGATFDLASGTTTVSTTLGGTTLTKAGAGTLVLAGTNTYASGTTVRAGTLRVTGTGALGSTGTVTLNDAQTGSSDASLLIDASAADGTVARAITIANQGSGTTTLGAFSSRTGGIATFSGAITLAKDVTLTGGAVAGDRTQFTAGIGGTGNVTIAGTTRVMFVTAANTYSGGTTLTANSILQLGDGSSTATSLLPDASVVTVGSGADLRIAKGGNATAETIGGLAGSGFVTAASGSDTLLISNAANQTFSGTLRNGAGTLNLAKAGAGTQTFSSGLNLTGLLDVRVGSVQLQANSTIGGLTANGAVTTGDLNLGANTLVVSGTTGNFYTGKITGTGTIQLRGGSGTSQNGDGTAGVAGNYQIWTAVTGVIQGVPSQFFALDTGASASDRKDFGFINDTGDALYLSSLTGYGAIRNDAGGTGGAKVTRQIIVDQSASTVFNGALLSHRSSGNAQRSLAITKRGSGSLELAGFIGKATNSSNAGTGGGVDLTVEAGVLSVTNAANTTTATTDARDLGVVTVTGGALAFSNQALLNTAGSVGASSIRLNGGTLRWNAGNAQDISAGGRLTLVAGRDAKLDVGSNDVTLATAFAGGAIAASVTKLGNGALTISAANTFTAGTTLSAGALQVGNDAALGTGALALNGGTLSSNDTSSRSLANAVTVGGDVSLGHATRNGALSLSGSVDLGGATRALTVVSAVNLGGVISNGGLTKSGNGTLTLSAANTYTGGTTVNAGTLRLGASGRLADTGAVTVNAGTLDLGGNAETVGAFTLAGGTVVNGTLDASGFALRSGTVGAALVGSSALSKTTAGVVTLASDSSAYTGSISVDSGTLSVTGSLAGSTISVASGAILRGTGTAGTVNAASGAQIQAGLAGAGSLSMTGLTVGDGITAGLAITDVVNYGSSAAFNLGTLTLGAGSSLAVTLSGNYAAGTYKLLGYSGSSLSSGNLIVNATGLSSRFKSTVDFSAAGQVLYTLEGSKVYWVGSAGQWSATGNWSILVEGTPTATSFLSLDDLVFDDSAVGTTVDVDADVTPTSLSFEAEAKSFTLGGTKGIQGGTFRKSGSGTVTINNTNAFTDSSIVGGTVVLGASAALGTSAIALNGGTLDLNGQSIANSVALNGGTLAGDGAVAGVISGNGALSKSSTGTLTLSGTNSYTGGTTVSNGVLVLGHATDTLANTGAVTVSGGELALGSNSDAIGALAISSGSISGSGTLTVASVAATNEGDVTVSANLAGSGATLSKSGAGMLSLTGTANYTGLTSISNGTLNLGSNSHTLGALAISGGTVSGSGTLTVSSVTATNAGSAAISAKIAGSGALSKSGAGTLTLSGANSYTGGTSVTNGVLSFANGSLGSTGNISVNGGTLRWATGNSQDIASRLVLGNGGAATLDTNGNDVSLAAAIGGATSSSLTKTGNGKLTLAAAATYTGATTVSAGTLQIGNGLAAGGIGGSASSLVTVSTGATLAFNRTGTLDYKTTARMRFVAGGGDIVLDGGVKLFNYTGTATNGFAEANSWSGFSGRLVILGGSEFQTIRNGRTAMGSAQIVLGDANTSGIVSQIEGNWTWTNNIQLVGSANIIRNNATGVDRSLKLQGVLSGSGNVTFADTGAGMTNADRGFILTGANTLSGQVTVDATLRVGGISGDDTSLSAGASGDLGTSSVVINSGKRLVFSRSDTASFANVLSGAGIVRVGSTGIAGGAAQDITLSGDNTYSGGTEVLQGTLRVASLGNVGSGAVTVRGGSSFIYTGSAGETTTRNLALDNGAATLGVSDANAVLTWNDSATKGGANGGLITKAGNGTLVLGGAITSGGSSAVRVSGGTLRLSGANTYAGTTTIDAGATLDIAGTGSLASGTAITLGGTLQLSTSTDQVLSGGITGAGSLRKTGSGLLTLSSDNSGLTGSVSVSGGTLLLGHLSGLGGSTVTVSNGATLDLAGYAVGVDLALNGGNLLNFGSWTGGLVVNYAGANGAQVDAQLALYGRSGTTVLSGGSLSLGGLTKDVVVAGGSLTGDLSGYTRQLTIRSAVSFAESSAAGKVILDGGSIDYADRSASDVIYYRGGTLANAANFSGDLVVDLPTVNLTAGALGSARVVVGAGAAVSIDLGVTNQVRLQGGSLVGDGLNRLNGTLTVAGGNTFDLDGDNNNLSIANAAAGITLESGAELMGNGTVGAITVQSGAKLAPGNSPGQFTAQSMTLGAGSYDFEVAQLTSLFGDGPSTPAQDYDTITVLGELNLSALSVNSRFVLNLISLGEDGLVGIPSVWDLSVPFQLRLFGYGNLNLGSNGDVNALFLINSSQFLAADLTSVDPIHFRVINDAVNKELRIAYSPIPEPSTYGLILGGLALAAAAYRRRKAAQRNKA